MYAPGNKAPGGSPAGAVAPSAAAAAAVTAVAPLGKVHVTFPESPDAGGITPMSGSSHALLMALPVLLALLMPFAAAALLPLPGRDGDTASSAAPAVTRAAGGLLPVLLLPRPAASAPRADPGRLLAVLPEPRPGDKPGDGTAAAAATVVLLHPAAPAAAAL
jgi:hypothetical protein